MGLWPSVASPCRLGASLLLLTLASTMFSAGGSTSAFFQTSIIQESPGHEAPLLGSLLWCPGAEARKFPRPSHLVVLLNDALGGQRVALEAPGQAQHLLRQLLLEVLMPLQDDV